MSDKSLIEWTDATWNPITGCSVVSPGCANCYAMKLAGTRLAHHPSRAGLTSPSKAGPVWNGQVRFNREWLDQPLRWKRPRRIFVCAHGDLFHESVPDDWINEVFAVMAVCPEHTFQVLTKRSKRMREYLADPGFGVRLGGKLMGWARGQLGPEIAVIDIAHKATFAALPNLHLGVSVEDQIRADERIPDLLATPAALRFISAEPLLGPIDLTRIAHEHGSPDHYYHALDGYLIDPSMSDCSRLDWVIAGGESGAAARPSHPDWFRALRDQCRGAATPFFFKQWGEWGPECKPPVADAHRWPITPYQPRDGVWSYRIGKARTGARLDGREYREFPR